MKWKGFNKLMFQVSGLGLLLIVISFFTETDFWSQYFTDLYPAGKCNLGLHAGAVIDYDHYHYNYRGVIYTVTGFVLTAISIFRIVLSHKEKDFKK